MKKQWFPHTTGLLDYCCDRDITPANQSDTAPEFDATWAALGNSRGVGCTNPPANRGVIAFAAWLNLAHAAVMAVMAVHLPNERQDLLIASAVFGVIGAALILLAPAKQLGERASATRA